MVTFILRTLISNAPIHGNWLIFQNLPYLSLTDLYTLLVAAALKIIQILKDHKILRSIVVLQVILIVQ